ncbi:MAG: 5-bromo-4-chloroindolyl phosphate hydrolysis family protein, partial [Lachnospiraceae bacterium]|nr:5-bromo-4-chloroindolyl phosphate hydrolysis family protein [Lachnospiraceae bacterium]
NTGRAGETMTDQWVRNHQAQTRSQSQQRQAQMDEEMRRKEAQRTPFFNPFTNRSRGKLKSIFGLIGTIGNGILAGMTLIGLITTAIVTGSSPAVGILVLVLNFFLIMLAIFLFLLVSGRNEQSLTDKYFKYSKFAGSAEYLAIADFARRIGVPAKTLVKDLRAMIKKGFLPSARIDERETTLMLTDNAYKMYLDATDSEAARQRRQQQDFVKQQAANAKKAKQQAADDAAYADLPEDVAAILREGRAYVRDVREINDRIPDTEEMSTKLYRLEDVMNKIFAKVQSDPSLAPSLRRFMSYYLPTTKKLLQAYVDLSNQPGVENITKTKQEIDQAMDTINDAYEKLLNDLFQNDAWDVSSDISVMQTMMAQDGLTEGPAAKAKSGRPAGTPAGKVTEKAREKVPVLAGADSSTGTVNAQPEPKKEQGIPQPELVFGVPEEARIDEE